MLGSWIKSLPVPAVSDLDLVRGSTCPVGPLVPGASLSCWVGRVDVSVVGFVVCTGIGDLPILVHSIRFC